MERNVELDVLRGLAVTATFFSHVDEFMGYPRALESFFHLPWGLGVDIFFVLSGFLITQSLVDSLSKRSKYETIRDFWIRRVYRIVPASMIWIVLATLVAILFLPREPSGIPGILRSSASAILNYNNFLFSYCITHDPGSSYCGGLRTLALWWSLSLEEQFYIVFPVILLSFGRTKTAIVALCVLLFYSFLHKSFLNLAMATRLEPICYGVLLALIFNKLRVATLGRNQGVARALGVLSVIALFSVAAVGKHIGDHQRLFFAASMFNCFAIVLLASLNLGVFKWGVVTTALAGFGRISYSFYLCHMTVLAWLAFVFKKVGIIGGYSSIRNYVANATGFRVN